MRDVIVWGLLLAATFILVRIMMGTPLIGRIRESFANGGGHMVNANTECPKGTQMYMYNGAAFCCSGQVNPDALSPKGTCSLPLPSPMGPAPIFCTLGPTQDGVVNCLELRSALFEAEGPKICPTGMPNYVKGFPTSATENGRCCKGPGNQDLTDCANPNDPMCDVTTNPNYFEVQNSCQFQRLPQEVGACPTGYGQTTVQGSGALAGMTLLGCSDNGQICYSQGILSRLQEMGYDTSSLPICSSSSN
jgi:hypothetical protein